MGSLPFLTYPAVRGHRTGCRSHLAKARNVLGTETSYDPGYSRHSIFFNKIINLLIHWLVHLINIFQSSPALGIVSRSSKDLNWSSFYSQGNYVCRVRGETRNMLSTVKKLFRFRAKRNNGRIHFREVVREGLPVEVMSTCHLKNESSVMQTVGRRAFVERQTACAMALRSARGQSQVGEEEWHTAGSATWAGPHVQPQGRI